MIDYMKTLETKNITFLSEEKGWDDFYGTVFLFLIILRNMNSLLPMLNSENRSLFIYELIEICQSNYFLFLKNFIKN
jgi:hypothetical protein